MRFFLILLLTLSASIGFSQDRTRAYINKYDQLAINIMTEKGIPASVVLGVAIHESGAGNSKLCRVYHNHFGVKGKPYAPATAKYRKFASDSAAYEHFAAYLTTHKFYKNLQGDMQYDKWLKAIRASGYAASKTWLQQVSAIIKKYKLANYDKTDIYIIPEKRVCLLGDTVK